MKLIVLAENTAPEGSGLKPEHGLSLYLEYAGKKLLLDAGASGCFADNAERLGVDLAAVELAVAAGAVRESVEIIDVEDVPLQYYPGNTCRVKIKAAGDLS